MMGGVGRGTGQQVVGLCVYVCGGGDPKILCPNYPRPYSVPDPNRQPQLPINPSRPQPPLATPKP